MNHVTISGRAVTKDVSCLIGAEALDGELSYCQNYDQEREGEL